MLVFVFLNYTDIFGNIIKCHHLNF